MDFGVADVPKALSAVVKQLLAKDADLSIQSAAASSEILAGIACRVAAS